MNDQGSVIFWFRKNLRLHDNPALIEALETARPGGKILRCVYIFDPWYKENKKICAHRYRFILQSLHDLDDSLRELGTRLFVFKGTPKEIFTMYFKRWKTEFITWEKEIEPYSIKRDVEIEQLADSMDVGVSQHNSHMLYERSVIIKLNDGKILSHYKKFRGFLSSIDPPARPIVRLTVLPDTCKMSDIEINSCEYDIPTLKDLDGIDDDIFGPTTFPGGETEGLRRVEEELLVKGKPSHFLEPSLTDLSPYLTLGCVSVRTIYCKIKDKYGGKLPSKPPFLYSVITWREYIYSIASFEPNFNKIKDNHICREINWDHDTHKILAWSEGKTGFPFIDAVMVQLKNEGWIHSQVRSVVACFLTRGDLWQSWEVGCQFFEEFLLDADWSLNAANWMRSSVSAFSNQYFRVFSPIVFGKKYDPTGEYIKKYLPQLTDFPPEYIYNPWDAPLGIQKRAGCLIGVDYPEPIIEHSEERKANLLKMKSFFANKKQVGKRKYDSECL